MSEYNTANRVTQAIVSLNPINKEFSYRLPSDTRVFKMRCRTATDVRFAYTQNLVAGSSEPYHTLKSGVEYTLSDIEIENTTIYFATGTACVVEIETWQG